MKKYECLGGCGKVMELNPEMLVDDGKDILGFKCGECSGNNEKETFPGSGKIQECLFEMFKADCKLPKFTKWQRFKNRLKNFFVKKSQ